ADAIRNYHKHYSYAMAISTIPDCSYTFSYEQNPVGDYTLTISGAVDRCPDWDNPTMPIEDLTLSDSLGIINSPGDIIKNIVDETIDGFIDQFSDPGNLLEGLFGFDLGSFF